MSLNATLDGICGMTTGEPLIRASHQTRRLAGVSVLALLGVVLMFSADRLVQSTGEIAWLWVALLGLVLAAGASIYDLRTIRCPRCGAGWLRYALGNLPLGSNFVGWLVTFDACPKCGVTSAEIANIRTV